MMYRGWGLTPQAREEILLRFPPIYPEVRCDHVTMELCHDGAEPPETAVIRAYGTIDFDGYQVLAVTVDGAVHQPRRDRIYHVTISHDHGKPSSGAGLVLGKPSSSLTLIQSFLVPAIPFVRKVGDK